MLSFLCVLVSCSDLVSLEKSRTAFQLQHVLNSSRSQNDRNAGCNGHLEFSSFHHSTHHTQGTSLWLFVAEMCKLQNMEVEQHFW